VVGSGIHPARAPGAPDDDCAGNPGHPGSAMTAKSRTLKAYRYFETAIVYVLLFLLMIMVLWATGSLTIEIVTRTGQRLLGNPPAPVGEVSRFFERFSLLHEVYGAFMLVLIGIELMKTVVMYLEHQVLHVEVVFTVAMIAIARHAIDLDLKNLEPLAMVGMGIMILALTVGYFYFRKAVGTGSD
jgi:uncharacterized membrane protein (DUF373 family)